MKKSESLESFQIDSGYYKVNAFNEIPLIIDTAFKEIIGNNKKPCAKLMDCDSKPCSWNSYYFSKADSLCVFVGKEDLSFDTVCSNKDTARIKNLAINRRVQNIQTSILCKKNYYVRAYWGKTTNKSHNSNNILVFIVGDLRNGFMYEINYNYLSTDNQKINSKEIEKIITSNIMIWDKYFNS